MPEQAKTWILLRGTHFKPEGSLSLGQILTKPFEPSIPLLPDGPLPVPETYIERTHQLSVDVGTNSKLGLSFKLWAEVDILPVRGEIGTNHDRSRSQQWHFDKIDSEIMVPRIADIRAAMKRDEVVAQINRSKFDFKKRLYLITGVRIARGASLKQEGSISKGINANFGVDRVTLAAVPVPTGPGAAVNHTASENYGFEKSSDFVFAYRVCEIHYRKEIHVKPYNRGDTFGVGENESSSEEEEKDVISSFAVEKMGGSDYAGSGVRLQTFKLEKGGQGFNVKDDGGRIRNERDEDTEVTKDEDLTGDGEDDTFILADQ